MTAQEDQTSTAADGAMSFLGHLEELRWRLLKSVLAVIVMSGAAFYFSDPLLRFLVEPLGGVKLHYTEVTGSFYAYLKISLIAGIMCALPVIFYQLWSFISPGLHSHEKTAILPLVAVSTFLFLVGAAFCYMVVLPISLAFLIGFAGDILSPIITVGSYISFAGLLLIAFGFGFQLPVLCYLLGRMGVISAGFLAKGRRYAIVGILIAGAIITPPDVFTQVLLAVPIYLLYEISIIVVRITGKRREGAEKAEATAESDDTSVASRGAQNRDSEIGGGEKTDE